MDPTGAVSSVAESMKGSPACLAAILLAGVMAILTYFTLREDQARSHEREMARANIIRDLITACPAGKKIEDRDAEGSRN